MLNTPPKHATKIRLTLGDYETQVTIGTVIDIIPSVASSLAEKIEGVLEHWTDDDGLHHSQAMKDIEELLNTELKSEIVSELL